MMSKIPYCFLTDTRKKSNMLSRSLYVNKFVETMSNRFALTSNIYGGFQVDMSEKSINYGRYTLEESIQESMQNILLHRETILTLHKTENDGVIFSCLYPDSIMLLDDSTVFIKQSNSEDILFEIMNNRYTTLSLPEEVYSYSDLERMLKRLAKHEINRSPLFRNMEAARLAMNREFGWDMPGMPLDSYTGHYLLYRRAKCLLFQRKLLNYVIESMNALIEKCGMICTIGFDGINTEEIESICTDLLTSNIDLDEASDFLFLKKRKGKRVK